MTFTCEACGGLNMLGDEFVTGNNITVQCGSCNHVFVLPQQKAHAVHAAHAAHVAPPDSPPSSFPWLVRQVDGKVLSFSDLPTMQRWIIAGAFTRDDLISRQGRKWRKLGGIAEFNAFFEAADERANARGQWNGAPLHWPSSEYQVPDHGPIRASGRFPVSLMGDGPDSWGYASSETKGRMAQLGSNVARHPGSRQGRRAVPVDATCHPGAKKRHEGVGTAEGDVDPLDDGDEWAREAGLYRWSGIGWGLGGVMLGLGLLALYLYLYQPKIWLGIVERRGSSSVVRTVILQPDPNDLFDGGVEELGSEGDPSTSERVTPGSMEAAVASRLKASDREAEMGGEQLSFDDGGVKEQIEDVLPLLKSDSLDEQPRQPTPRRADRAGKIGPRWGADPTPTMSYQDLISAGYHHLEHGRPSTAVGFFSQAVKANPQSPEPLAFLGWCHFDMGNNMAALDQFRAALEVGPQYGDAFIGMGRVLENLGKISDALQWYERYLSLYPKGSKASIAQGRLRRLRVE